MDQIRVLEWYELSGGVSGMSRIRERYTFSGYKDPCRTRYRIILLLKQHRNLPQWLSLVISEYDWKVHPHHRTYLLYNKRNIGNYTWQSFVVTVSLLCLKPNTPVGLNIITERFSFRSQGNQPTILSSVWETCWQQIHELQNKYRQHLCRRHFDIS